MICISVKKQSGLIWNPWMKPLPLFEIKNDVYITLNKITEPIAVEETRRSEK